MFIPELKLGKALENIAKKDKIKLHLLAENLYIDTVQNKDFISKNEMKKREWNNPQIIFYNK